ncbi:MAG: T9SS type A sorting domain-containing protein [Bacteroidales bacterium]|nr:T9SS type A sorting domain-containing protein [Bacteroidales bacterium]
MKNFYKISVLMMICFFIAHSSFAELTADFTVDQPIVMAGNPIQFTDLSTGNPTILEWDFENDGTIDSYEQNPEWTYNEVGVYSVSLTVSDGTNNDTELKENYITVIEAQAPVLVCLIPGQGSITLNWEEIPLKKTNHFNFEGGNPAEAIWAMYIGEAKISGEDMEAGDEIGIYDGDLLVGAFTLNQVCTPDNQFENVLNAFADLYSGPGYVSGNPFTFVAWDESEQTESIEFDYTFSNPYGDAYTGDVFPEGHGPYSIVQLAFNESGYIPAFNIYLDDGTLVEVGVTGNSYVDYITPIGEYCYYITQIMECGIESNISNIECVVCPPPPRAIYGNISEISGAIEGAQVVLEGTSYSAISNKYGRYCIFDIEPGTYDITATAEGYNSVTIYDKVIEEYNFYPIDFLLTRIQNVDLEFGFQFISSKLIPENPDMLIVAEEILNENLDFMRNSQGQTLRKIGPNWINGIGDWIIDEGYLVKMNTADSFTINGTLVDPSTPIPVEAGFQFVSYFPENSIDALIAFGTIIGDDLDFIRGSEGTMIRKIGPNWVNGIGDCQPGKGYLIKMFSAGEIIYPATAKSSGNTISNPTHFNFKSGNPSEPVYTLYIKGLEIGDEVAAYDGDKMVGSVRINSEKAFDNELPVFSTLTNGVGYEEGNTITFKVWSENTILPADFTLEAIYDSYVSDVYPEGDGKYSVVNITKGKISNSEETISVYPNPSDGIFNISFEGIKSDIQIKVLDLRGKEYSNFIFSGSASKQLDLTELTAGVYFISFSGKDISEVKKIVIK